MSTNSSLNQSISEVMSPKNSSESVPFKKDERKFFSKKSFRYVFGASFLFTVAILTFASTFFLSRINQDIRQQASGELYYNSYCSTFREEKCFGPDLYRCDTPGTAYLTLIAEDAQRCVGTNEDNEDDGTGTGLTFTCCIDGQETAEDKTIFACQREGGTVGACPRDETGELVDGCTTAIGVIEFGQEVPQSEQCSIAGTRTWFICDEQNGLSTESRRDGCPQPTESSEYEQSDQQISINCDQSTRNCTASQVTVWVIDSGVPQITSQGFSTADVCSTRTVQPGNNYPRDFFSSQQACQTAIDNQSSSPTDDLIVSFNDKETGENIGRTLLDNGVEYTCSSDFDYNQCRRGYQCTTDGWVLAGPTTECAQDRLYLVETEKQLDELLADTALSGGPGAQNLRRCPLSPNGTVSCICASGDFRRAIGGGQQCPQSFFIADIILPGSASIEIETNVEDIVSPSEQVANAAQEAGRVSLLRTAQATEFVLTLPYDGLVASQNFAADNDGLVEAGFNSYLHGQRMKNLYLSGTPYATDEWLNDAYEDPGLFLGGYANQCGQVGLNVNCAAGISVAGGVSGLTAAGGVYAYGAAGGISGIATTGYNVAASTTVQVSAAGSTVATRVRPGIEYVDDAIFQFSGIPNGTGLIYNTAQNYTALQQGIPPHLALYSTVNLEDDLLAGINLRNTVVQQRIATTGVGNQQTAQTTFNALQAGSNVVDESLIALAFRANDAVELSSTPTQLVQNTVSSLNEDEQQLQRNALLQQTRNFCYLVPGGVRVYTSTPTGGFPAYRVNSYVASRQVLDQEGF